MSDFHYFVETGMDGGGNEWTPLYWTIEPPAKEGWYWTIDKVFQHIEVVFVEWAVEEKKFFVNEVFSSKEKELSEFSYWLGPLPEPETPK